MPNVVGIVIEIHYYHMNMNGVDFLAGSTCRSESLKSLKNNVKIKFINRLKYAEVKIFPYVKMYIKFMKVMILIKYMKFYPH